MAKNRIYAELTEHVQNTTYSGATFTVTDVVEGAIDITDASISMVFKKGSVSYEFTNSGDSPELEIVDGPAGQFAIKKQVIAFKAYTYDWQVTITMSNGDIKQYSYGTWPIIQKLTHDG